MSAKKLTVATVAANVDALDAKLDKLMSLVADRAVAAEPTSDPIKAPSKAKRKGSPASSTNQGQGRSTSAKRRQNKAAPKGRYDDCPPYVAADADENGVITLQIDTSQIPYQHTNKLGEVHFLGRSDRSRGDWINIDGWLIPLSLIWTGEES